MRDLSRSLFIFFLHFIWGAFIDKRHCHVLNYIVLHNSCDFGHALVLPPSNRIRVLNALRIYKYKIPQSLTCSSRSLYPGIQEYSLQVEHTFSKDMQ